MPKIATEVEISFDKLLEAVDQLSPKEKVLLRKRLDENWAERFEAILKKLRESTKEFTPEEVEANVREAIKEVRAKKGV